MTLATSAAELKFLQRLLQSSHRNFSTVSGAGIEFFAVSFTFRSSSRWVRQ